MATQGGNGVKEALQIYTDLADRFTTSLSILNGIGACYMQLGKFAEAEKKFVDAVGMVSCVLMNNCVNYFGLFVCNVSTDLLPWCVNREVKTRIPL